MVGQFAECLELLGDGFVIEPPQFFFNQGTDSGTIDIDGRHRKSQLGSDGSCLLPFQLGRLKGLPCGRLDSRLYLPHGQVQSLKIEFRIQAME